MMSGYVRRRSSRVTGWMSMWHELAMSVAMIAGHDVYSMLARTSAATSCRSGLMSCFTNVRVPLYCVGCCWHRAYAHMAAMIVVSNTSCATWSVHSNV